jgi:methionyl-tRNA synthetase
VAATEELSEVIFTLLEGIRWTATAFLPLLPQGMPEVFRQLGLETPAETGSLRELRWGAVGFRPVEPRPIYPRLELPVADATAAQSESTPKS